MPLLVTCWCNFRLMRRCFRVVISNLFQIQTDFMFSLQSNLLRVYCIFLSSSDTVQCMLEWFIWKAHQFHRYDPLDGLHTFKTDPLDDPLRLGEKEKDLVNREVVEEKCSTRPGTAKRTERCEQVYCCGNAATICPITTLFSSTEWRKRRRISK